MVGGEGGIVRLVPEPPLAALGPACGCPKSLPAILSNPSGSVHTTTPTEMQKRPQGAFAFLAERVGLFGSSLSLPLAALGPACGCPKSLPAILSNPSGSVHTTTPTEMQKRPQGAFAFLAERVGLFGSSLSLPLAALGPACGCPKSLPAILSNPSGSVHTTTPTEMQKRPQGAFAFLAERVGLFGSSLSLPLAALGPACGCPKSLPAILSNPSGSVHTTTPTEMQKRPQGAFAFLAERVGLFGSSLSLPLAALGPACGCPKSLPAILSNPSGSVHTTTPTEMQKRPQGAFAFLAERVGLFGSSLSLPLAALGPACGCPKSLPAILSNPSGSVHTTTPTEMQKRPQGAFAFLAERVGLFGSSLSLPLAALGPACGCPKSLPAILSNPSGSVHTTTPTEMQKRPQGAFAFLAERVGLFGSSLSLPLAALGPACGCPKSLPAILSNPSGSVHTTTPTEMQKRPQGAFAFLAERVGFEPTVRRTVRRISSPVL